MFLMAGQAPRGEHIDEGHVTLAKIAIGKAGCFALARDRGQGKGRDLLADKRGGQARGISSKKPDEEKHGQRREKDQRNKGKARAPFGGSLGLAHVSPGLVPAVGASARAPFSGFCNREGWSGSSPPRS